MLPLIVLIPTFLILAIAAAWDIKTLEVPDWLNYGGIALGISINAWFAIAQASWMPLVYSGAGLLGGFLIGSLMYYTGQWGGGDAKLLMAVGALTGFRFTYEGFGIAFLTNLMMMGAVWGIAYMVFLAVTRAKKTYKVFTTIKAQEKYSKMRLVSAAVAGMMIVSAFFLKDYAFMIVSLAIIGYLLAYMIILVRSVELSSMHKWVSPSELVEGDWLVHTISEKGKTIAGPSNTGLKKTEIAAIRKMYKKKQIGKICVKYGVPFTPAFLLSYVVTLAAGNLIIYAIHL